MDNQSRVFIETLVAGRASHTEVDGVRTDLTADIAALTTALSDLAAEVAALSPSFAPPLVVATGDTFTVNDNTQVLFALPITVDGTVAIDGSGVLVGVD